MHRAGQADALLQHCARNQETRLPHPTCLFSSSNHRLQRVQRVRRENQNWETITTELRKNVIKKINNILKIDITPLIEKERIYTPKEIELKTQSYLGSLYGASSNNKMSAFLRHPNFSNNILNLYFCGGSVHPGGGIPLCLLSAKIVSNLIK